MYWGKLIGGLCGLLFMGPFGLFLGLALGHAFDRGLQNVWRQGGFFGGQHNAASQKTFFNATFLVMGHIAKADGRVSEAEIAAVRGAMNQMGLKEAQIQQAMELFNQGKQPDFELKKTLTELVRDCHHNKVLLRMFVELQLRVAVADGHMSPAKHTLMQTIYQQLGFAPLNFAFFENLFNFQQGFQQQWQQQQQYQQGGHQHSHGRRPAGPSLQDSYAMLGIAESASDADVKKAYRRLMSQHHPDKLVSKGLPEQMIKLATEKTQNIKAAYERICAARGI